MMDHECAALLPSVCELLSTTRSSLPDDTSLEKLLDWFTVITKSGVNLLHSCPCLLEFITNVVDNSSPDPSILSFTMKLTGLIAGNETSFQTLQKGPVLASIFNTQRWHVEGLWDDPSVRTGWIWGLRSMLEHPKACTFFLQTDLIEPLLQLQTDTSIFVVSAANQLLSHLLIVCHPAPCLDHKDDTRTVTDREHLPVAVDSDNFFFIIKISKYLEKLLVPKETSQLHQSQQVLKLLALLLKQSSSPQREKLLLAVTDSLEEVVKSNHSQLTLPLMDVILAAHSCCGHDEGTPDQRISHLLKDMLNTRKPADLIQAAAAFLHSGYKDHVHSTQSVRLLLLPLDIVTGLPLLGMNISATDEQRFSMLEQLRSKTSCISLVSVSLANIPQIAQMAPDLLSCPPGLIVSAVLIILRLCSGDSASPSGGCTKASQNVTGSSKVLKSALESLSALSNNSGAHTMLVEVFSHLLNYLDNPDCNPTVLQKLYLVLLKWLTVCTDLSCITDQHKKDLIQVVRKRACDVRWEVRDSTVEFLGQLAGVHAHHKSDEEVCNVSEALLGGCCLTTALLKYALQDSESYVRASAISALSLTLTVRWQQGAASTHDQVEIVTQLLGILSQDEEGFARRAVMQYFTTWFSSGSLPSSLLMESVCSVLSLGSLDLDWEVKVHTQNLAELLLDKAFSSCENYIKISEKNPIPSHPYASMSGQSYTLHTYTETQTIQAEFDLVNVLDNLVQQGVISALFRGLLDCDRPVALKACRLLIKLRDTIRPLSLSDQSVNVLRVTDCELSADILTQKIKNILGENGQTEKNTKSLHETGTIVFQSCEAVMEHVKVGNHQSMCVGVYEVLMSLDLDKKLAVLSQSSDYISNSPLSLLQDILTVSRTHSDPKPGEEVIVDCY